MTSTAWRGNSYTGGVFGGANGSAVRDCVNYGKVTGNCYVGGVVASCGNLYRCANFGEVTATILRAGGISAEMTATYDSINAGKLNNLASENGSFSDPSMTYSYVYGSVNCYTLYKYQDYEVLCTVYDLNSKSFYTDALGWSEEVCDLSSLDFEAGLYPKLKK